MKTESRLGLALWIVGLILVLALLRECGGSGVNCDYDLSPERCHALQGTPTIGWVAP